MRNGILKMERFIVTAPMFDGSSRKNDSFSKLFKYIPGENKAAQETAPPPQDLTVKLEEMTNLTVATITFNGSLKQPAAIPSLRRNEVLIEVRKP